MNGEDYNNEYGCRIRLKRMAIASYPYQEIYHR